MRKLLLLLTLLLSLIAFGQQYSSFWYNSENGLPQNSVKDIVKDKHGFIWLATEGGIVRYDGYSFLSYKNLKLSNLNFYSFKGDISSNYIINSNIDEQQYILIKNRNICVSPKPVPKNLSKYIYYRNKRYLRINKINSALPLLDPFAIQIKNEMYFFEEGSIIYRKNKTAPEKIVPIPFKIKDYKKIFLHGNTIFFRSPGQKKIITIKNGSFSQVIADPLYNDPQSKIFCQQFNDQIFVINQGKIYISEFINGTLKLRLLIHLKNIEIDFGTLSSIFYDKEYNSLYLGTYNQGLCIIKISSFHIPKTEIPLESRIYYTTLPFTENSIINTQGRVFDQNTLLNNYHFDENDSGFSIAYDESGNIIYPKNSKIYRFKRSDPKKTDSISVGKDVLAVFKCKGIYVLQLQNYPPYLLNIYTDDNFKNLEYSISSQSPINTVRTLNDDKLLIGRNNGLFIFSRSKKTLTSISSLHIKNIVSSADGNFWIISRGEGFYLLKNNKLIKMPYDDNGYISSPHNVLEDKKGFLWIPTNNGLFKVLKSKLLEYAKDNKTEVFYYRYTKKAGFNTNEFNGTGGLSNVAVLKNGNFVLPSMDGYVFFDPLTTPAYYPNAENIYVERARSKGSNIIYFKDTLNLENDFAMASVFIDIPYYSNNDNLYVETNLQKGNNRSSKWQRLKDREYTLGNLSPGDYTLNVRVLISPEGKFTYKKVSIIIPPLFYQTLWFKMLVLVCCIGIILLIITIRTRILTTKNNQLKKIVYQKNNELKNTQDKLKNESEYQKNLIQTINHDITTPIKYLSAMSQKLSETDNPKLQKQYFNTIYKSSEELYKFTLNLKNYTELFNSESLKYQEDAYHIFDILETKKRLFEEIASQKNTIIVNNSSKNIKLNFNESIMAAVIHNLLDNAVKNTLEGHIVLDAKIEDTISVITISDSGAGMKADLMKYYNNLVNNPENKPSSFKNQGLGLHLVIQLLKKIGGKIIFRGNEPTGTKVKILIQNHS